MDIMRCCMTWTKNILQAYSGENSTFFLKMIFQGPIYKFSSYFYLKVQKKPKNYGSKGNFKL